MKNFGDEFRKRAIYTLIVFILILMIHVAVSNLLIYFKPWRAFEIKILSLMASILGAFFFVWFGRRPLRKKIFFALLGLIFLSTGGIYFKLYLTHQSSNSRSIWFYIDLNKPEISEVKYAMGLDNTAHVQTALLNYFRNRKQTQLRDVLISAADDIEAESDRIMKASFSFSQYASVNLKTDMTWSEDPYGDRSWNFQLHTMNYIPTLVERYHATGDTQYLQRAEDLVFDWIQDNTAYFLYPPSEFSWGDHSTALRVGAWLTFWESWTRSPLINESEMEVFLSSLFAHAEKLADPDFYTEAHNHGITQDMALLEIIAHFPELAQTKKWGNLAKRRLEEQIRETISSNGVHLEHSPGYHIYMLDQINKIRRVTDTLGISIDIDLKVLAEKMATFSANLITPTGQIAPLGDTAYVFVDRYREYLLPFTEENPALRYALSLGKKGDPPGLMVVYPEEGYAFIRDYRASEEDFFHSLYIMFTAAANKNRGHKHSDDLSFILTVSGHELLTDPGVYSYKLDPAREYVTSAQAHSTVVVDGVGFKGWDSHILNYQLGEDYGLVQAVHYNNPGLSHCRTLLYVRPSLIFVIDELRGLSPMGQGKHLVKNHVFEQLFHLGRDVTAKVKNENTILAVSRKGSSKQLLVFHQLGGFEGKAEVIKGVNNPMQGWISEKHGEMIPAPVARFTLAGADATFLTALELPPFDSVAQPLFISGRRKGDDIILEWSLKKGPIHSITISRCKIPENNEHFRLNIENTSRK